MKRGAHKSTYDNKALVQLRAETKDKVAQGYARVVRWGDIKSHLPRKLKLSPVAMIPHKSKPFRCILDLSFAIRHKNNAYKSVNDSTIPHSRPEAMTQLGTSLHCIVNTMAKTWHPDHPFYFVKLDIKDGFWRVRVNDNNAWNFCYVLPPLVPTTHVDNTEIVVPNSLQMGWCESPALFCTCSETARDIIVALLDHDLSPHKFETIMLQKVQQLEQLQQLEQ